MSTVLPLPPRTNQVLPAVAATLLAKAEITAVLMGSGRVYVGIGENITDPPQAPNWRRLVLMTPKRMLDQRDHLDRVTTLQFLVRADDSAQATSAYSPALALDAIQEEVFKTLEGLQLSLTHAKQSLRIHRVGRANTVYRDPGDGYYFATTRYKTVLSPP